MVYYCEVCDITIEIKNKNKHLNSLLHSELDKCLRIKHNIDTPGFLGIDSFLNGNITNHNKKLDLCISLNMTLLYFLLQSFIYKLKLQYNFL